MSAAMTRLVTRLLCGAAFVTACARADAQLDTFAAGLRELPELRTFSARVEAVHHATVSAETSGRIEEIRVDIGDLIAAGTVILTITSTEQRAGLTRAEAALAEATATLATESVEYERARNLLAQRFIAQADMDRATLRLEAARARVASGEAAVRTAREQLSYTEVRAPYAGVVSARMVEPGELVQPGMPLMAGYDPATLRVELELPQSVAAAVRALRVAHVAVDGGARYAPDKLVLYPAADPATGTVRVRLELPASAPDLYPGQFVTAQFTVGSRQGLLIPEASLVERAELSAVYVVSDGVPALRQVRTGAGFAGEVEVLAGLESGELVARDPAAAAALLRARAGGAGGH